MDPKLLILIALTDGAKTVDELLHLLQQNTRSYGERNDLLRDLDTLSRMSPSDGLAAPAIRQLPDDRIEFTTEGNVWLSSRPVIRFIVAQMNNVERHGLPRGVPITPHI